LSLANEVKHSIYSLMTGRSEIRQGSPRFCVLIF
jgi:hypothetical protein